MLTPSPHPVPVLLLSCLPLILALHPLAGQAGPTLAPPSGPALTLDGTIQIDEWRGALEHSLAGHGQVFFMRREGLLSVGVRGPAFGLAHLAVASEDTVRVLHASAALGAVVYVEKARAWEKVQDPAWEMRDPSLSPLAIQNRQAYLDEHGWVGTTGRMGADNEVEFLLRPQTFGEGPLQLAVVFFPVDPQGTPLKWPDATDDDVDLVPLLTGPMPESLHLAPEKWGRLEPPQGLSGPPTSRNTP